jgi:hypothetical protein
VPATTRNYALFVWLISHQPALFFSQNKPATSNQTTILFSQNKPAPAISHQPNEQAVKWASSSRTTTLSSSCSSSFSSNSKVPLTEPQKPAAALLGLLRRVQ